MGGGLMQLVAYGAQDIYLTGNPQMTFFKVVYRKHTNFSMESIQQTFSGTADFGNEVVVTISRNGDLVGRMYLEHAASFTHVVSHSSLQINIVERYGDSLIKECEIEIGGQSIDKHTSMWNRVWSDLTEFNPSGYFGATVGPGVIAPSGNGTLYQLMTGNTFGFNTGLNNGNNKFGALANNAESKTINGIIYSNGNGGIGAPSPAQPSQIDVNKIFLPLNFWFNRNPGLALPLIALQYHEVKVKMTFESLGNLIRTPLSATNDHDNAAPFTISHFDTIEGNFNLWCDYIYLDIDERRRFAQVSHEYLIEQLQYSESTINSGTPSIDLNFNHPVKELIWCMRNETAGGGRHQTPGVNLGDASSGPVSLDEMRGNWQLKLNGQDRFKERYTKYFTRTQVWQHHTGYGGIPSLAMNQNSTGTVTACGSDSIAVYSFALKPEEHQPSGTCNFSRIDNTQLVGNTIQVPSNDGTLVSTGDATANNTKLTIFAVNYNVLRIMSGMGGLAYSN